MMIHAFVDGACSGNPGPMGAGIILQVIGNGVVKKEARIAMPLTEGTNNQAEFLAVKHALLAIKHNKTKISLVIFSDSQTVVNGLAGHWKISSAPLIKLRNEIVNMLKNYEAVSIYYASAKSVVPGDPGNYIAEADALAKLASEGKAVHEVKTVSQSFP